MSQDKNAQIINRLRWVHGYEDTLTMADRWEAAAALENLSCRLAECESINANLRLQAEVWACEADTQKSTVHECYQIVTGAKGEPGDWSGSKPVREAFNELKARVKELEAMVKDAYNEGFRQGIREHTSNWGGISWKDSKFRIRLESSAPAHEDK
jgi:hypothetical protein